MTTIERIYNLEMTLYRSGVINKKRMYMNLGFAYSLTKYWLSKL